MGGCCPELGLGLGEEGRRGGSRHRHKCSDQCHFISIVMAGGHVGSLVVGSHGLLNPVHEVADPGVDTRLVLLGTAIAPGDNSLKLSVANHRATRITLQRRKAQHIL